MISANWNQGRELFFMSDIFRCEKWANIVAMGCWFSKKAPVEEPIDEAPKEYSWDKRKKEDKSRFYVRDVENVENSVCRK